MADPDPVFREAIDRLRWLYDEAGCRGCADPHAASLATADVSGRPSVRTVTVMSIEDTGPVFFVNSRSGKGRQLDENPRAALCFYWPDLHQQVTLEGQANPLDAAAGDRLWAKRSHDSRIAAWVWDMEPVAGEPAALRDRVAETRERFAWDAVPRPTHWQAVLLAADVLQFWRVTWRNLRTRERYALARDGAWWKEDLQPL